MAKSFTLCYLLLFILPASMAATAVTQ
ncbi:hypothetical protein L195_g048609, partial [Trifolium pratense]